METRCENLIKRVIDGKCTKEDWLSLKKQYDAIVTTASAEELDVLEESGIGEMLYMICSGL